MKIVKLKEVESRSEVARGWGEFLLTGCIVSVMKDE
jgi:hypothetical protein